MANTFDTRDSGVLSYIIEAIPYKIFWKDRECKYLGCNKAFAEVCGLSDARDIVGMDDYQLPWPPEQTEWFRKWDNEVMERGEPQLDLIEPQLHSDGTQRVLLTSKVPLRNQEDRVVGILGIFTDITERVQMENELRLAKEAAEEAKRRQQEFYANISHELRTPLTLIKGPLEALFTDPQLAPVHTEIVERALRNAARLHAQVNNLLDVTRSANDGLSTHVQIVDLNVLLASIVQDAEETARQRTIHLSFTPSAQVELVALDADLLEKIVLNLLGNALKFTNPGGRVQIRLTDADERFEIHVEDNGIGIPEEQREQVFERFRQVDGSRSRRYEGSGIGLALVKDFVTRMGGDVALDSEVGTGSHFCVRLPKGREHLEALQNEQGLVRRRLSDKGRVHLVLGDAGSERRMINTHREELPLLLFAEDNRDMRAHVLDLLKDDYRAIAVANGRLAVQELETCKPDVILSDWMMPEMDGEELVHHVKQHPDLRHIPIILLTAKSGPEAAAQGLDTGADDYLSKPFSPNELKARLRAALRTQKLMGQLEEMRRALFEKEKLASLAALTAGIAHELKNPLNFIINFSMMTNNTVQEWEEMEAEEKHEAIDDILNASQRIYTHARRADRVIDAMSRHSTQDTIRTDVALTGLIEQAWNLAYEHFLIEQAEFRCAFKLTSANEQARFPLDEEKLERALINMFDNALYSLDQKQRQDRSFQPVIEVRVVTTDERLNLELEDNGLGISETVIHRVFEPFFTTKAPALGIGLGLSIADQIVTRDHGGSLTVKSNPGENACFTIRMGRC